MNISFLHPDNQAATAGHLTSQFSGLSSGLSSGQSSALTRLLAATAALLLSACAQLPPESPSPNALTIPERAATGLPGARPSWPATDWWKVYQDPQLNHLIELALQQSPSLDSTRARLLIASAQLRGSQAGSEWSGQLNANVNRQRYSGTGLFPPPIGGNYYTEQTVQAQWQYQFDWWGKQRAKIAAAAGEAHAREAEIAIAERQLVDAVLHGYFAYQAALAHQASSRVLLSLTEELRGEQQKRLSHGLANADELRSVDLQLAELRSQMAAFRQQSQLQLAALNALLGLNLQQTGQLNLRSRPLPEAQASLPQHLGLELLARRPDLQAAQWRVQAAISRVEWSQAAYYPDINLSAAIGLDSIAIGDLLKSASRTVYLAPALSLPLFDQHRLDAQLGERRGERDLALADYRQSVVVAIREVAQAVAEVQASQQQQSEQQQMLSTSAASQHASEQKLQYGLTARQSLLNAQLNTERQRDACTSARLQHLLAQLELSKALGGGYQAAAAH